MCFPCQSKGCIPVGGQEKVVENNGETENKERTNTKGEGDLQRNERQGESWP